MYLAKGVVDETEIPELETVTKVIEGKEVEDVIIQPRIEEPQEVDKKPVTKIATSKPIKKKVAKKEADDAKDSIQPEPTSSSN